jgi:hypothetical protein
MPSSPTRFFASEEGWPNLAPILATNLPGKGKKATIE